MTLGGFAISNLLRRPARTLLTILGIALAVGTAVALLALGRGITDSVARGLDEHGAEFVVQPRSSADVMSARMPEALGRQIEAFEGVSALAGELYASAVAGGGQHLLVAGWSAGAPAWARVPIREGRTPKPDERAVMVGDVLAEALGVAVGGRIEIFDESFDVVGITRYATAINRGLAIMPLTILQETSLRPGQVSLFLVQLRPDLDASARDAIAEGLAGALPVVVSRTQEVLERDGNVAILRAISEAVSIIALAMGALNLFATLLFSVQERVREIGMLSAMGWSDGRIVSLVVIEGLLIGIAGCTFGVVVGFAASALFDSIPTIGTLISFSPRLNDLVLPLALALPLCAIGAAYPAWRAVCMLPSEALRRI